MKVAQTINDALIDAAVINPTEEPQPADGEYALREYNRILEGMMNEQLLLSYSKRTTYDKDSWSKDTVTIGAGEEIDAPAPATIETLTFLENETTYQLRAFSYDDYNMISYHNTVAIPSRYAHRSLSKDKIEIAFNCVPQYGLKLILQGTYGYSPVTPNDDIEYPAGIEELIKLRIAINISPSYNINLQQSIYAREMLLTQNIKAAAHKPRTLKIDPTLRNRRGSDKYNLARM